MKNEQHSPLVESYFSRTITPSMSDSFKEQLVAAAVKADAKMAAEVERRAEHRGIWVASIAAAAMLVLSLGGLYALSAMQIISVNLTGWVSSLWALFADGVDSSSNVVLWVSVAVIGFVLFCVESLLVSRKLSR